MSNTCHQRIRPSVLINHNKSAHVSDDEALSQTIPQDCFLKGVRSRALRALLIEPSMEEVLLLTKSQ